MYGQVCCSTLLNLPLVRAGKRPFNVHNSQLTWLIMEIIGLWFKVEKPEVFRKPVDQSNWTFLTLIEKQFAYWILTIIIFNKYVWSTWLMKWNNSLFLARSNILVLRNEIPFDTRLQFSNSLFQARADVLVLRNEIPFWYEITSPRLERTLKLCIKHHMKSRF